MEYQNIMNFSDNTPCQPSKLKTKILVEIIDDSHGTYNTNSQIKFKTSMLISSLYDYSDAHILVKGTISVAEVASGGYNDDKEVVSKNFAPFTVELVK